MLFFWIAVLADLFIIITDELLLRCFTKPLLMPVLAVALLVNIAPHIKPVRMIAIGLFFSFLGDVLLLNDNYFIPGLICFLLTHIFYIIYFAGIANKNGWYLKKNPWILLPVVAYTIGLVGFLLPKLGTMTMPVAVYAGVISFMLASCINLYRQIKKPAYIYLITGACFFVLSDSLLAINKFYQPFSYSGLAVMITYALAQYLIVKGTIAGKADS